MFTMRILEGLRDQGVCSWAVSESNRYGVADVFIRWRDEVRSEEVDISMRHNIYRPMDRAYDPDPIRWGTMRYGPGEVRMPMPVIERVESKIIHMMERHFATLSSHDRLSVIGMVDAYRKR